MTEACVIEIRMFNLQMKQMDLKSFLQTNVDNLHSDTINEYLQHKDERTSIHLAYTAVKICDYDSHISRGGRYDLKFISLFFWCVTVTVLHHSIT